MELYHNNMSVCSQKVRLVLHEKNLKPTEHHLNLRKGDQSAPEYVKLNPKAVVPTVVDDGQPIIESTIICEYLDDAYPAPPLRPQDPIKRAHMRVWTQIPDTGLHGACATISFAIAFRHQMLALGKEEIERQLALKPDPSARERQRETIFQGVDAPSVAGAIRTYDKVVAQMSRRLDDTPYLAGDEYSLADVALTPYVLRLEHLALSWMWEDKRPSVGRWLERCKSRKNYSGIGSYIDPKYLDVMGPAGREARGKLEALLAH